MLIPPSARTSSTSTLIPPTSPPLPPTPPSSSSSLGRRTLRSQLLNSFRTASGNPLPKVALMPSPIIVTITEVRSYSQPPWSNAAVSTKHVKSPPSQAEMLSYVEHLYGLV